MQDVPKESSLGRQWQGPVDHVTANTVSFYSKYEINETVISHCNNKLTGILCVMELTQEFTVM